MFSTLGALALFFSITSLGAGISPAPLPTRYQMNPTQDVASFQYLTGISNKDFHTVGQTTYLETYTISNPGTYVLVEDIGQQGRNSVTTDGGACAIYINSSNVVLDLGNKTLYENTGITHKAANVQKGIDVAHNVSNVSIKNGNIAGFYSGIYVRSGCRNIRVQDLTISDCIKYGIAFSGGLNTANNNDVQIGNSVIDNTLVANTTGFANDFPAGLFLNNCHNILVNNSAFQGSKGGALSANATESIGALICTSTNVQFKNCDASSNYGFDLTAKTLGFLLTSSGQTAYKCSNCTFTDCTANDNFSKDTTAGIGFGATHADACIWDNCTAGGNYGHTLGCGFQFDTVRYSKIVNCTALNNHGGNQGSNITNDGAFGFASTSGTANIWENCLAQGQTTSSNSPNIRCVGFHLFTESRSLIRGCDALYNNGNAQAAYGIGLCLTDTCVDVVVDNCRFMHNLSATGTSGVGSNDWTIRGAGIFDTDNTSSTIVTNCFFLNNGLVGGDMAAHIKYKQEDATNRGSILLTTTINVSTKFAVNSNYPTAATLIPYSNVFLSSIN